MSPLQQWAQHTAVS